MLNTALFCMALNIYHEARGEPAEGQFAVASIVINRAIEQDKDICTIVKQPNQFSWVETTPFSMESVTDKKAWELSMAVAKVASLVPDKTNGATHYHAKSVHPRWADKFHKVSEIGKHRLYKKWRDKNGGYNSRQAKEVYTRTSKHNQSGRLS